MHLAGDGRVAGCGIAGGNIQILPGRMRPHVLHVGRQGDGSAPRQGRVIGIHIPLREPVADALIEGAAATARTGTSGGASHHRCCGSTQERGIECATIHGLLFRAGSPGASAVLQGAGGGHDDLGPRIGNTNALGQRSLRPWVPSPWRNVPDSDDGRPRSRCHRRLCHGGGPQGGRGRRGLMLAILDRPIVVARGDPLVGGLPD